MKGEVNSRLRFARSSKWVRELSGTELSTIVAIMKNAGFSRIPNLIELHRQLRSKKQRRVHSLAADFAGLEGLSQSSEAPHVRPQSPVKRFHPNRYDVAVFPLFNAVLFPGSTLPIQIIEARYQKMLEDLQAKGWPLAVSLVFPPESDNGEVLLNTICGAGSVQVMSPEEEGTSKILVHGERRIRLCSVIQQEPYLVMEAEDLEPEVSTEEFGERRQDFERLQSLVKTWAFLNPRVPDEICPIFDEYHAFDELTDFFVFHFLEDAREKQQYLDCPNALTRAEMLNDKLSEDLERFSKKVERQKRKLLLH